MEHQRLAGPRRPFLFVVPLGFVYYLGIQNMPTPPPTNPPPTSPDTSSPFMTLGDAGHGGTALGFSQEYPRTTIPTSFQPFTSCFRKNNSLQKQEVVAPHFIRPNSVIVPHLKQPQPPAPRIL